LNGQWVIEETERIKFENLWGAAKKVWSGYECLHLKKSERSHINHKLLNDTPQALKKKKEEEEEEAKPKIIRWKETIMSGLQAG
jgi:hypothetical protein